MRCQLPDRNDGVRQTVVVIIIFAWLVVTIRTGFAWLTPVDIAFFGLLLGRPAAAEAVQ